MTDNTPKAAPATRRVPLCLDADAQAEWAFAREAVRRGKDGADEWLATAEQAAAESTVVVEVKQLSWDDRQDVLDDHPPRIADGDVDRFDLAAGHNRRTFPPALVFKAIVAPDLDAAQWATFRRDLTAGQFEALFSTVRNLADRRTPSDIPFESAD